jgi:hypothetical protein
MFFKSAGPGPAEPDRPTSLAFGSLRAPLAKLTTRLTRESTGSTAPL